MTIATLTEREWQRMVVDLARTLGWQRPMHIYDSRRSEPGWPDLALVRERLLLLELKTDTGKVSDAQARWLRLLHHAHVEVYVARPRHLDQLGQILSARGPNINAWTAKQQAARLELVAHIEPYLGEQAAA